MKFASQLLNLKKKKSENYQLDVEKTSNTPVDQEKKNHEPNCASSRKIQKLQKKLHGFFQIGHWFKNK